MTIETQLARVHLEVAYKRHVPTKGIVALVKEHGLHTQPQEAFWVIANDRAGNLYTIVEVARGSSFDVSVHLPALLTAVLAAGADTFSVAHNHPTQSALPSQADYQLTHDIMEAANACGMVFEEHVIVEPGGDSFSFRDAKLILPPTKTGRGKPLNLNRAAAVKGKNR